VGVDTGGTFTDLVLLDDERVVTHKVRSTPDNPARAILEGIAEILAQAPGRRLELRAGRSRPLGARDEAADLDVVHGSTVATNALLERKGARVGLVTTAGFEDVLRIGRQTRRALYDFLVEDRRPIVEPGMTLGVRERLGADGEVVEPLDAGDLEGLVPELRARGAEAVAVCLLHAYANPAHERAIAEAIEAAGFSVSASHRVLPEYREFERWSTTVVNTYVTPLMARYLSALEAGLGDVQLRVMQSSGGSVSAAGAKAVAVQTILSGPAAGAVGALAVSRASGFPRAISFDMGGTSTDVSLLDDGIGTTSESTIGDFPVRLPVVDIHTVGAGGGSIAFVDAGGSLRVGPCSAGADPGPACYGTGTDLTVTDANLLLGRLDPGYFFGGRMMLDVERARSSARALATRLGLDEIDLADGVLRVANSNMVRAIRVVSVERGVDPREFALVAFGGAGAMHACEIAATLDIATVVVPRHAGVLSALGMLLADVTRDYSSTLLRPADALTAEELAARFAPLAARATRDLRREGFGEDRIAVEMALDLRYVGQSYELTVPFGEGFRAEFDRRHELHYGYAAPSRRVEVVTLRVRGIGRTDKPRLPRAPYLVTRLPAPSATRAAWFGGKFMPTPVFREGQLGAGMAGHGPVIVAGAEATAVVPPDFQFHVDEVGSLILTRVVKTRERTRRSPEPAVRAA
jgi:N-methylhydantoinase A/oxoprolinase/acetone carboxylase beta subunit